MSTSVSTNLFGGSTYAQKWSRATLKHRTNLLTSTPTAELLRILISFIHIKPVTYTELSEDIQAILQFCLTSATPNCTSWVRTIAGLLKQGGLSGQGFGVVQNSLIELTQSDPSLLAAVQPIDHILDELLQKLHASDHQHALTSTELRRFAPHETVYLDSHLLPTALQLPTVTSSLATSNKSSAATISASFAPLNPHCQVRGPISFDFELPKEDSVERTPSSSMTTTSTSPPVTNGANKPSKPLSSASSLFATRPRPVGLPAPGSAANFQKRGVIQMLDMKEAHAAMDTSTNKRRKTAAPVATMTAPSPPTISPEEVRRQKEAEKERAKEEKLRAREAEKEAKEAEKKAAAEAKAKEKEEKAQAKLERDRAKEEEKEKAKQEREKQKEEREAQKRAQAQQQAQKKITAAAAAATALSNNNNNLDSNRPLQAVIPPMSSNPINFPPGLIQAMANQLPGQDPTGMFTQPWQQQSQMQPPYFFPPQPTGMGMSHMGNAQPFNFPMNMNPMNGMNPMNPMNFSMQGPNLNNAPVMATTVATLPNSMQTPQQQQMMSQLSSSTNMNEFPAPPPLPSSMMVGHNFTPPNNLSAFMPTQSFTAPVLATTHAAPTTSTPMSTTQSTSVTTASDSSSILQSQPQPPPSVIPTENIFLKSNKVTQEEKELINKFLKHQPFPPPPGTKDGVFEIILNEDVDESSKETTVFLMTLADWSWRKVKRKKKLTKKGAATTKLTTTASAPTATSVTSVKEENVTMTDATPTNTNAKME